MRTIFADLHIHIGKTESGEPVKISGSRDLTFYRIAEEASERKGIELIGIIDCHSPRVLEEIEQHLQRGDMNEVPGGGIRYRDTTILLGSEIEVRDEGLGPAHLLAYMPDLATMQDFSGWMARHMKNVNLSSQRIYVSARVLQNEIIARGGLLIPAHVFTPHKSVYGSCVPRMSQLLDLDHVAAIELGLSADTEMAAHLSELDRFPFLSNSDAHSLGKIGREYNELIVKEPSFAEIKLALLGANGRKIAANYGLNPRLGKYHRTYCTSCNSILDEERSAPVRCLYCGSPKMVRGVIDRIKELSDRKEPRIPPNKPPYRYQVPLEFIPGLGPRARTKLLEQFGTEMNILHHASTDELARIVGDSIAAYIQQARTGTLAIAAGGGGIYGKVTPH